MKYEVFLFKFLKNIYLYNKFIPIYMYMYVCMYVYFPFNKQLNIEYRTISLFMTFV